MIRTVLLLVVGLVPLAGCGGSLDPEDFRLSLLEANEAKWDSLGPDSYVYAIQRNCFCPLEYRGPVRVTVQNGVAVGRVYVDSGLDVPGAAAPSFPTVDGLFDILRDAMEAEADRIDVTYDPDLGVPLDFWIDYSEMAADEELGMEITEEVAPIP